MNGSQLITCLAGNAWLRRNRFRSWPFDLEEIICGIIRIKRKGSQWNFQCKKMHSKWLCHILQYVLYACKCCIYCSTISCGNWYSRVHYVRTPCPGSMLISITGKLLFSVTTNFTKMLTITAPFSLEPFLKIYKDS